MFVPHYKFDEQPNERPKKGYFPKKKRKLGLRRCGCCEKRVTIGLRITRLRCTRFSRRKTVLWKPGAISLGTNSKNTIHSVYATSSKYAGKQGPSLGKNRLKNPHQRSPCAMKFDNRSHEETERQQQCARSKAWNFAKHVYKLKPQ